MAGGECSGSAAASTFTCRGVCWNAHSLASATKLRYSSLTMQEECMCSALCKHGLLQGSVLECTLPCCHETEIRCLLSPCRRSAGACAHCAGAGAGGVQVQACSPAGECVGMQRRGEGTPIQNYRNITSEWPNMAFLTNFLCFAWLIFDQS